MLEAQRQKLAYIVARMSGQAVSFVYAHHIGEHTQMGGLKGEFLDYRRGERFSTTHDHATGARWTVEVNGAEFSGYNYGNGHHFTGQIALGSVRLFDHGVGTWFDYGVQAGALELADRVP